MNRSAEQTNRPRTASRFTRFVCPALRFIPHEPRKKDTHSLTQYLCRLVHVDCVISALVGVYRGVRNIHPGSITAWIKG